MSVLASKRAGFPGRGAVAAAGGGKPAGDIRVGAVHRRRHGFALSWLPCLVAILSCPPSAEAADVYKGREVYEMNCQVCHGQDGKGLMMDVPDFSLGDGLMQGDTSLFAVIRAGKTSMPSFDGILQDRDILDVIAYIRTLQR